MQTNKTNCKSSNASNGVAYPYTKAPKWVLTAGAGRWFSGPEGAILSDLTERVYGYGDGPVPYTSTLVDELTAITKAGRQHVYTAIKALVACGALVKTEKGLAPAENVPAAYLERYNETIAMRSRIRSKSLRNSELSTPESGSYSENGSDSLRNPEQFTPKSGVEVGLEAASGADSGDLLETHEKHLGETNHDVDTLTPPTPPEGEAGERVSFLRFLQEAEWLEGEQAKVMAMFKRDRLEDMTVGLGPLAEEKIREFLAMPANLRAAAWENMEAAQAEGVHVRKPLKWLMEFMADPTHFPEVKKPEPSKVVNLPARKPWQWMYEGKGTFDDVSWAWDRAQIVGRWLNREYDWRVIRPMAKEKGLDAVLEMLHNDLEPLRQEQARKKAAQVSHG